MDTIEEKQVQRFQFLRLVYEKTSHNRYESVDMYEIGDELGFTRPQTESVVGAFDDSYGPTGLFL